MVSLFCRAIRSISWLTMNEGGRARRPPGGIRTRSRHIGHLHHTLASVLARGGAGRGGDGGGLPEAELPRLGGHDPGEAAEADRVGAGQQLGPVLRPVIAACVAPVDMVQCSGQVSGYPHRQVEHVRKESLKSS